MKKIMSTCLCLGALSLSSGVAFADTLDLSLQDVGSQHSTGYGTDDSEDLDVMCPEHEAGMRVTTRGDWIQSSDINKKHHRHQHSQFWTAEIQGEGVIYYDKDHDEGLGLGIGYERSHFHWRENPFFNEKKMGVVTFSLLGFSQRVHNWMWQGLVSVNWEPKYKGFFEYTNYDLVFWGRYKCTKKINFHMGFVAQTGMKIDHILPILGFDWTINEKWKLNVVFPVNLSLLYIIDKQWSASLAGRFFNVRYRFGKHEPTKKALFEYRNYGAEVAVNYLRGIVFANIHAGVTVGGQFVVSNRHHHHKEHYLTGPAGYAGAEVALKF